MLLPLAAIAAAGCGLLVSAGRLESLGLLEAARRRARTGGWVAAAGSLTTAGAALLLPGSWLPRAAAAALALGAGEGDEWFRTGSLKLFADGTLCLLYTSPSPRDGLLSRMPSSA